MEKIKVLIADDHPTFRDGLCRLLGDEGDLDVVAGVADGEEAIRLAKELSPDVAIIDVAMPGIGGIEAARQIKSTCPTIAILMVSAYGYEPYILASLRAGAAGYLLKDTSLCELVSAIHAMYSGKVVFDFRAAKRILHRIANNKGEEREDIGELQCRELEALKLLAKGMSNKRIAVELGISERTVQTHLVNIYRKLGVCSRTEAVLHALKESWFTLDDL